MHVSQQDDHEVEGVTVRYWAGARAAAGVAEETLCGVRTVGDLVGRIVASRPALGTVIPICSVLVGGRASSGDDPVPPGAVVEVLPPFAGG